MKEVWICCLALLLRGGHAWIMPPSSSAALRPSRIRTPSGLFDSASSKSWVDGVVKEDAISIDQQQQQRDEQQEWIRDDLLSLAVGKELKQSATVGPDTVIVYDTTLRGTSLTISGDGGCVLYYCRAIFVH